MHGVLTRFVFVVLKRRLNVQSLRHTSFMFDLVNIVYIFTQHRFLNKTNA